MGKLNTTKKEDLINLFNRHIKIYGKETKEIKQLLKSGFIIKSKNDNGDNYYVKK